jgi:hypothetical protein
MLKRHEVEILLKAGHSKAEVARLAGVSLCSVKRIAEEVPVVHVDDAADPGSGSTTSIGSTTSCKAIEQRFFAAPWNRDCKSKFLVPPTLSIFFSVH